MRRNGRPLVRGGNKLSDPNGYRSSMIPTSILAVLGFIISGTDGLLFRLFFLAYNFISFFIISQLIKRRKVNKNFKKEIVFPVIMCTPGVLFSITPFSLADKLFIPVTFLCIGTIFVIFAGMYTVQQYNTKKNCKIQTIASIIGNRPEKVKKAGSAYCYFPIVTFCLPDGSTHKTEYDTGLIAPKMTGQTKITYNISNPNEFYFSDNRWEKSEIAWIFIFLSMGILFIAVSAAMLLVGIAK